jgi:hypothetical protein
MQYRPKSSFLFLALILVSGQAASAATLFPNRARGWNKIAAVQSLTAVQSSKVQGSDAPIKVGKVL